MSLKKSTLASALGKKRAASELLTTQQETHGGGRVDIKQEEKKEEGEEEEEEEEKEEATAAGIQVSACFHSWLFVAYVHLNVRRHEKCCLLLSFFSI